MQLTAMLAALEQTERHDEVQAVLERLPAAAPADWRRLAAVLAVMLAPRGGAVMENAVVGIAGGQGAGKSTLAALLVEALALVRVAAAGMSLDDCYLTRAERRALAAAEHPLLATRGVPGTHDVSLCRRTITELTLPGAHRLPVFDKGADDRRPPQEWLEVRGPIATVILEGWCLGAPPEPQARLARPVNELEAREDRSGHWRRFVNRALEQAYGALWSDIDFWVYLKVPDIDAVLRWREQQEQALPAAARMDRRALERFVQHYERLTRWMFECMPGRSNVVVELAQDHSVSGVALGGRANLADASGGSS